VEIDHVVGVVVAHDYRVKSVPGRRIEELEEA
jgi:hypothetical protein